MTEKSTTVAATPATEAKNTPKAVASKKAASLKAKNSNPKLKTHPTTALMVNTAIKTLAERTGSSLQAIKKYIAATYTLDVDKHAPFIKKFLKTAVTDGLLIQVKGKGANGSFKLPSAKAAAAKPKSKDVTAKKTTVAKKPAAPKKPAAKKSEDGKPATKKAAPKKTKATTEKKTVKATAATKKTPVKSLSPKAKKATKAPTAKPRAPKPKKTTTVKTAKPVKKVAAKK